MEMDTIPQAIVILASTVIFIIGLYTRIFCFREPALTGREILALLAVGFGVFGPFLSECAYNELGRNNSDLFSIWKVAIPVYTAGFLARLPPRKNL